MKYAPRSTDNAHPELKRLIRQEATAGLGELRVLDAFAGANTMWDGFDLARYYGIEKVEGKGANLHGDNRRVLRSIDVSKFNVIDLDAYGYPVEQLAAVLPRLVDGTRVVFTMIANSMSQVPNVLLRHHMAKEIHDEAPTLLNPYGHEMFYSWLHDQGVEHVRMATVNEGSYRKDYGWFTVKNAS